jgi:hypothetical protein
VPGAAVRESLGLRFLRFSQQYLADSVAKSHPDNSDSARNAGVGVEIWLFYVIRGGGDDRHSKNTIWRNLAHLMR